MPDLVGVPFATGRTFVSRSFLVEADAPAHTIYLIRRGQVRLFRLDEDGREEMTGVLGPGQLVGVAPLLGRDRHSGFAQAMTTVQTWAMPTDRVLAGLATDRALLGLIAGALAQRFALTAGLFRDVRLLPVLQRVADVEIRLATSLKGEPIALKQFALAQLVHARPETLARQRGRQLAAVPHESLPRSASAIGVYAFKAGQQVLSGDLPSNRIAQVRAGKVQLLLVTQSGRSIQFDILERDDVIGVSGLVGMPELGMRAVALSDGALQTMDWARFLSELADQPDRLRLLGCRLAARLEHLEERLARNASIPERLIELLDSLTQADRTKRSDGCRTLPRKWSHARLGQNIGVARETVTRTLAQLEARGALHREGRRIVLHSTR